jgi:hypothetical protein
MLARSAPPEMGPPNLGDTSQQKRYFTGLGPLREMLFVSF